jgi:hypothetical protein
MSRAVVTETISDKSAVLSMKQVHNYTDRMVDRGHAEYNQGSILVRSKHPMDECLRCGIIEEHHHEIAKRIRNYRDCAVSKLSGRAYNALGEGDAEMDAGTIYANLMRTMNATPGGKNQWKLISVVCFTDANIDGNYLTEREYGFLYQIAPNLQRALETVDGVIADVREELQRKLDEERKRTNCHWRHSKSQHFRCITFVRYVRSVQSRGRSNSGWSFFRWLDYSKMLRR